jgi:hypothetical protein
MSSPAPHNAQREAVGKQRETGQLVALDVAPLVPSNGRSPEMLFLDVRSDSPLPDMEKMAALGMAVAAEIAEQPVTKSGIFWLDGDALLCACPDCGAPMSVRLWLMIADCWRCGISIELSQQQEADALRLLQQREQAMRQAVSREPEKTKPTSRPAAESRPQRQAPTNLPETMADTMPSTAPPIPTPSTAPQREKTNPQPQAPPAGPRDRWAPVPERSRRRTAPLAPPAQTTELSAIGTTGVWLRDAFRDMPAWLVSLIVHMVILTLLGLITYGEEEDNSILLSSTVSSRIRAEGEDPDDDPAKEVVFDLPIPDKINTDDPQTREVLVKADQDARELRIDADAVDPQLPDLAVVKNQIGKGGSTHVPLVARDPRDRGCGGAGLALARAESASRRTLVAESLAARQRWPRACAERYRGDFAGAAALLRRGSNAPGRHV